MKNITSWIILPFCLFVASLGCQNDQPIERIEFPIKEFVIESNVDTVLFGEQGTRIFIGAETFQFSNGDLVKDSLTIELKEFYKKSDIILAELSTESNGEMLETAGMVHIKASVNEEEVIIRPEKRVVVHFPKERYDRKKMKLFYADNNASDTMVTNWNIDTVNLVKKTLKLSSFGWWYPSENDSTRYDFIPRSFVDTGYYWNPLDLYVRSYNFSNRLIKEIERTKNINDYPKFDNWNTYGVECEMYITTEGFIRSPEIITDLSDAAEKEMLRFLRKIPQLEPGKNKYGEIIERHGLILIKPGNIVPLYQTDEAYIKSFDEKYAKYEDSPIRNMDDAEINFYIFSVTKLGWINCDRFLEFEEKTDLIVNTEVSDELKLKMVFSDINGVLKPKIKEGKYIFYQVPVGQKATIVGIKNSDTELLSAFNEIKINEAPIKNLNFSKISLGKLRQKLDEI